MPFSACFAPGSGSEISGVREVVTPKSANDAAELEVHFDPCEEIRRQLADSRRAFSIVNAG